MDSATPFPPPDDWLSYEPAGAGRRVYLGVLHDLETGRMVPGQRLIETELAARFEVGRNAVREAMQHLVARGVVDLSPNRSPAIRRLNLAECMDVMDVASAMTRLAARAAAAGYHPGHAALVNGVIADLDEAAASGDPARFGRARRIFYRAILLIGGSRELQRLFPAIGMHIIHAQYPSHRLQGIRLADYRAIIDRIAAGDADAAERAVITHVENVRAMIRELTAAETR
ncbi:GntR family transcriptional regulator [Sphingomonas sp. Root710]|uniref:GntR family transcriptional regulator n=1 Tax=Sphingomonas sp. Root710 TaxID=1736594 RepID=UPI0006F4BA0C|nr:GntR family transcriptional regulator [Sphingomonas sp. Root710]KRB82260.1 GntR family transcriptional regulator [Sphingomonas sp. Root710]